MKIFWVKLLIPFFLLLPLLVSAQNDTTSQKKILRHEIGLDVASTIFLVRKDNIYLINYKYHFKNHAIRSGINLTWETNKTGQKSIDYRLGFEWKKTVKKWQVFYGVDFGYSYKKYNFQKNTIAQYIVSPLIGFRYYVSPRFSISTEPKLAFKYIVNRDPQSFNPDNNNETMEIGLASIGVVLLNFHF